MRTTIMLAAAAALLAAAPAFALSGHTPQTNFSGPGSVGSIQDQDMQRSAAPTDRNAQTSPDKNAVGQNATDQKAAVPLPGVQPRDPADPQMNPHNVFNGHR